MKSTAQPPTAKISRELTARVVKIANVIPERLPEGKPQGLALQVNLITGECTMLTQE